MPGFTFPGFLRRAAGPGDRTANRHTLGTAIITAMAVCLLLTGLYTLDLRLRLRTAVAELEAKLAEERIARQTWRRRTVPCADLC